MSGPSSQEEASLGSSCGSLSSQASSRASLIAQAYICYCQVVCEEPELMEQIYEGKLKGFHPMSLTAMPCLPAYTTNEENRLKQLIDMEVEELKRRCVDLKRKLMVGTLGKCPQRRPCPGEDFMSRIKPKAKEGRLAGKKKKASKNENKDPGDKKAGSNFEAAKKKNGKDTGMSNCLEYRLSQDEQSGGYEAESLKLFTFKTDLSNVSHNCFRDSVKASEHWYPNGVLAACFRPDGTASVFYPTGALAILITAGRLGKRLLVMSKSGHNERGEFKKSVPVGLFDSMGNAVVYDIEGKIRMNYDQAEGILYDTGHEAPARWQWRLQKYLYQRRNELRYIKEDDPDDEQEEDCTVAAPAGETGKSVVSRRRSTTKQDRETIASVHSQNSKTKSGSIKRISPKPSFATQKKSSGALVEKVYPAAFMPSEVVAVEPRPISLKFNQYISLKIQHQEHVHIDFAAFPIHLHLNIGVKVKPSEVLRIDKVSVREPMSSQVPCYFELLGKRTRSMQRIQRTIRRIRTAVHNERLQARIKTAKLMGELKFIKDKLPNKIIG